MSTNLECQLRSSTVDDGSDSVNLRDLTRSVELFVVSEQVMADNNACETSTSPRCICFFNIRYESQSSAHSNTGSKQVSK